MKTRISLYLCRRNLNVSLACLLSFSLFTMPLVPMASAMGRAEALSLRRNKSQAQPPAKVTLGVNAPVAAPAPEPFAPVITATKVDALLNDDGDGKADPGTTEKIEYTVTVSNTGTTDAADVVFSDTIDAHTTLVPGSVNTQPIADPDTYSASGNIQIAKAAPGVLANDRDPDPSTTLTVSKVQGAAVNVGAATDTVATGRGGVKGSVTLNSDGSFTYDPAPGFEGSDSFTYEITDGTKVDTATVTINISGMVWFISNNAGGLNRGTFTNPFTTIASFNTANAGTGVAPDPKNNDFISLRTGTGTYSEVDGVNLRQGQRLIGNGILFNSVFTAAADSSSAYNTFATTPASAPTIVTSGGNGIDLSLSNTVRGLNVGNTPGFFKINGGAVGSPIIDTINLTGTGGALNVATSGAFGSSVTFNTLESTSSPTSNLNLVGVTGTLGISGSGTGFSGSAASSAAVNVTGGTVTFNYPGAISKANAGALVFIQGGHSAATIAFAGNLSATAGTGLQFDNADGTYNFNGTTTLNGGDAGIDILNGSSGTFNFNSNTSITSPTGAAFNVGSSPGTPNVDYNGTITQNTLNQSSVNIDGTTGGTITFDGAVTGDTDHGGIDINNATSTITFTVALTLGTNVARMTNQAITINGGGTAGNYNFGAVSVFTNGAGGIVANNFDGTLAFTGVVNATAAAAGANASAISIDGPAGLTTLSITLTSVSANNALTGVLVRDTNGTFVVNGTGTTDSSGGTISNITNRGMDFQSAVGITLKNMTFTTVGTANGADPTNAASTCGDIAIVGTNTGCNAGIHAQSVSNISLDNIDMNGGSQQGINGDNVTNFSLTNSNVLNFGDQVRESGIKINNLLGTSSISNSTISGNEERQIDVQNDTGTLTQLLISSVIVRGSTLPNGAQGILFSGAGAASMKLVVQNSTFGGPNPADHLRSTCIQTDVQGGSPTMEVTVTGSTFQEGGATLGAAAIDIIQAFSGNVKFDVSNNPTFLNLGSHVININQQTTSTLGSLLQGRINNNTIGNAITSQSGTVAGSGIRVRSLGLGTTIANITNNTVRGVTERGIFAELAESTSVNNRLDTTITNNTVNLTDGIADRGILVHAGIAATGDDGVACADIANNNAQSAGVTGDGIRVRQREKADLQMPGYTGGLTDGAAVVTYLQGRNPATTDTFSASAVPVGDATAGFKNTPGPGNPCTQPSLPSAPLISSIKAQQPNYLAKASDAPESKAAVDAVASAPHANASNEPSQASFLKRAANALATFVGGITSQIEPTAHAATVSAETPFMNSKAQSAPVLAPNGRTVMNHARSSRSVARNSSAMTPMMAGENVTINIGTLRAGDSVTITFQVTVNNPPNLTLLNPPRVSNQGTVSGTNFSNVLTDDPSVGGASDPTETEVDLFDTTTTLASDLNPSNFGDLVTFTATVAENPTQATADPTGTVDFIDTSNGNAVICDDVALNGSFQAQCQTSTLTAGTHNIRADYSGDGNFDPSQSNVVAQVVIACTPDPVVTSAADDGSVGTLREALASVCTGDTITFNIAGPGPHTITLTTGELPVTKNVTIRNDSGESITVSGNNASRVFNINASTTATIIGLTISGGQSATSGGGILNDGTLTIVNSTLTGNNTDIDGGAISNSAPASLTLINTTISGNNAAGNGGGVVNLGGTLTSINSTFTNNRADSDNNATGTGGGIHHGSGTTTLHNTIVAGNFNEDGASDAADDISGTVDAASSFNLIGTGGAGGLTNGVNNNQVGVANPGLGALANNGGTTSTHALLSTSTAVDAGSTANLPADTFDLDGDANVAEPLPVDQRGTGFPRTVGSSVDVGAFELGQADLSITKTDGSATEVPGTSVTYTIVVTNNGPSTVAGATVSDTFPGILTGVTFTSVAADGATGNTAAGAGNISDTLNMPSGSSVTYTVNATIQSSATGSLTNTATVTAPASVVDPTPGNNSATDTDTLSPTADLSITKTDGSATEVPGTPVTYTIVVTNNGPSDANGATVADMFPAELTGVTFTSVAAGGATGNTAAGSGNISDTLNMPAGSSVTYTVNATVSGTATGNLTNTATVTAPGGVTDPTPGNNSATDTDTLNATADLSITKTDGSATEVPGTPVTYTITVTNSGPSDVSGATVADTFPAELTGVTFTSVAAGGATGNTAAGSGNINDTVNMPSGSSITYTVNATVAASATGTLSNTATVTAPGGVTDPTPGNNSATDSDTLVPSADVSVTKTDSPDPVQAGSNITYTITVTNSGPSDAQSLSLSDAVPANTTLVSVTTPAGWTRTDVVPAGGAGTLTFTNPTLAAGASSVFTVVVNVTAGTANGTTISNTATVSSTTADPTPGNNSATETTLVQNQPNITIQDAQVAEPKQGSVNMIFTVTLSAPAPAAVSVNFTTQDLPPSITSATADQDYTTTSGTVNFAVGEQFKTILVPVLSDNKKNEANEQFLVNLSNPVNATIADGTATGTIIENDTPGALLISEIRTSGPAGAGDDFVEIYNNSDSPHVVNGTGGGYGLFKMGASCSDVPVLIGVIPNGTTIPGRGHYLFTGSAYSLADYGGTGAAAGDTTMSSDIESDRNVAIFTTATLGSISSANRLDAVGFGSNVGGTCDLFREGNTLTPTNGTPLEHSYLRDECGKKGNPSTFGNCPTGGMTKDSTVNADDFFFVDTNATPTIMGQRLGAPGPQNLGSPRFTLNVVAFLLDSTKGAAGNPNRVRDTTAIGPNAAAGTMSIRRRFQNNTGAPVTKLRIRVVDISTTFVPSGGVADLRVLSSGNVPETVNDPATCTAAGFPSTPCSITVLGTTLETPPAQPLGGGFNSSVTTGTITLATPLAPGASVNLQILLGVQTTGSFKFFFNIEALP